MNTEIRNILCPTDFSESALYAFQYAVAFARSHDAELELLHVIEPSAYATDRIDDQESTYTERVRERLQNIASTADPKVKITIRIAMGVPYITIIEKADAMPADLIVIGTHGRTGIRHLLIGSVAEKVVRTATCPVLTVRHPDHTVVAASENPP